MNKEEKSILDEVNKELFIRGIDKRFELHPFFPALRIFELQIDQLRTARILTGCRKLKMFIKKQIGSPWGETIEVTDVGEYTGRGWLKRLVKDAADVVEWWEGKNKPKGNTK